MSVPNTSTPEATRERLLRDDLAELVAAGLVGVGDLEQRQWVVDKAILDLFRITKASR